MPNADCVLNDDWVYTFVKTNKFELQFYLLNMSKDVKNIFDQASQINRDKVNQGLELL